MIMLGDLLTGRVLERYHREIVLIDEFIAEGLHSPFDRLVIGNDTLTAVKEHVKFIDASGPPIKRSELAKEYLRHIWETQKEPKRRRVPYSRESKAMLETPHLPLLFKPLEKGEFTYVDIDRAYFQIMLPAGLDCQFKPAHGCYMPGGIRFLEPEWLGTNKSVYTALVGLVMKDEIQFYSKGVLQKPQKSGNIFLAPDLIGLIKYTLHAIANDVADTFNLAYWNIDGMMVPAAQAESLIEFLWDRWQITASVRYPKHENRQRGNRAAAPLNKIMPIDETLRRRLKMWRRNSLALD